MSSKSPSLTKANLPDWLEMPIVMAGNWEPLAHRRRALGGSKDDTARYEREHSSSMIDNLLEVGANAAVWHFYKGFGKEHETAEMQKSGEFAKLCRDNNIKFGTYINFGSIYPATFFKENPQAVSWLAVDAENEPHTYSELFRCYYRLRPCLNSKEYRKYVLEMALYAIEICDTDWIHFDNNAQMACYCEKCQNGFRKYLADKFGPSLEEFLGHTELESITLPKGSPRMGIDTLITLHEPVLTEWVKYRCHVLAEAIAEVSGHLRKAKPGIVIGINPTFDSGEFGPLLWGCDVDILAPDIDIMWSEDLNLPKITDTGNLIGHLFTFKYAQSLNCRVAVHQPGATKQPLSEMQTAVSFIEAAVFNKAFLGHVYHAPDINDTTEPFAEHIKAVSFIKDKSDLFTNSSSFSQIALLRSSASHINNWSNAQQSRLMAEQTLARNGFQFDIISESNLDNIDGYNTVILPDVISISDENIGKLSIFIHKGGHLIATGYTAECNQHGQPRYGFDRKRLFGDEDKTLSAEGKIITRQQSLCNLFGLDEQFTSNLIYIPQLISPVPFQHSLRETSIPLITDKYWHLPLNAHELVCALDKSLAHGRMLSGIEHEYLVAQTAMSQTCGKILIHLLNYNTQKPVNKFELVFRHKSICGCENAQTFTYSNPVISETPFDCGQDQLTISVEPFEIYRCLILNTGDKNE